MKHLIHSEEFVAREQCLEASHQITEHHLNLLFGLLVGLVILTRSTVVRIPSDEIIAWGACIFTGRYLKA